MPRLRSLQSRLTTLDTRHAKPEPKKVDPFYHSPEYRLWRTAVISRAGGVCEHPGCSNKGGRLYADHIVEIKDGGDPLDTANGRALCHQHHAQKTAAERAKRMSRKY